jgi:hypothetical protein
MNSKNKAHHGSNQDAMQVALAHPNKVFTFRHHVLDESLPFAAIIAPGHREGPTNANLPPHFDVLDVAYNATNPQGVNREILRQNTRLGAGSAQFREPEGRAFAYRPVVWSEFPRLRDVSFPVQMLLSTLVEGERDWLEGATPSSDEAALRAHVANCISAGRSHNYEHHGFELNAFQSLDEILACPGVIHPITGEDTGRHWFAAVGRVESGIDAVHRERGAAQWRYNCCEYTLIWLPPTTEFGPSVRTPLDPEGRLNLMESLAAAATTPAPEVEPVRTPVVLAPVVHEPTEVSTVDTRPYWHSFGVDASSTTHAVGVDSVLNAFDSVNNPRGWQEVKDLFRIHETGGQQSAAVAVANAVRYWLACKMYGRPVMQESSITSYGWTVKDIKDLVSIIASIGASRGLEASYLPVWDGDTLAFGVGGPVFHFEGEYIYDYRGRQLQNVVETHFTAHRAGNKTEYRLEGLEQVSSSASFMKLVYLGYLPLLAQSITRVMDSLAANFAEFCRSQWVSQHICSFSKDRVREQNSAARLRTDYSYPVTVRQPFSPFKGGTWVRLADEGRFAANLLSHYEGQIAFNERDLKEGKKEAIRLAYRLGGLDYRYDKQLLVSGGLGAVNCRLLAETNPEAFLKLQQRFGINTDSVLVHTLKMAKGLKRAFLSMAQSVPVKDAHPAGFLFRNQKSPVEGFLAKVVLAPTVVATPGMSASVGLKPVALVDKTVKNYVICSFHESPQFEFGLGCVMKAANLAVSTNDLGVTRYTLVEPVSVCPGDLLAQVANPTGAVNDVIHTSHFEGDLQWLEYEVTNTMVAGKKELKVSWGFVSYESDMKARSIAKALVVDVSPELILNERNELDGIVNGEFDLIHFKDSLKVDVWWSYLMCLGTTLRYNWDQPELAELQRLAVEVNARLGHPTFKGILIDTVHIALGHYDALQAEFRRVFAQPVWFRFAEMAAGQVGQMLHEMHQSSAYDAVDLNDGLVSYIPAGQDPADPETNVTSFLFEGNTVTEVWQRGLSFVGTENCSVYNVELFESTTPKENVGESWQFPAELRAAQHITNNGFNPKALAGLTQTIANDVLPNIASSKVLEAMGSGSTLSGMYNLRVHHVPGRDGNGYYHCAAPDHAQLKAIVAELSVDLTAAKVGESFKALSKRLAKVVFTFKVNGKDTSIWLPALYDFNRLRSSNESGQTLSSVFYRQFLVPLLLNNRVDEAVGMMVRGKLSSLLKSSETPKLLKGRGKIGGRRVGLPNIPIGETWVLYSEEPNSQYQNLLGYACRLKLRVEVGLNDGLVGYNSRAPLAAGWFSKLRVITPLENAAAFWQLGPSYIGVNPIALYIDGGDCDGDSGYWAYTGPEFAGEILDYKAVIAIRNAGMDGDMRFTGSYAYDHYTRKSFAAATVTMSSDCVAKCVMASEGYIEYNVGAHVVQHEAVGAAYKLYMIGEHLIDVAQAYRVLGIKSTLLSPFMDHDALSLVLVLAEIYETILGGFSPEALELFEAFLQPTVKQGEQIPESRRTEFRKLLERFGANSLRSNEILHLMNVIALVISTEIKGELPKHYADKPWDGLALTAAHFTFEIGRGRFHGFSGAFSRSGKLANSLQARGQNAVMVRLYESLMTGLVNERELYNQLTATSSVLGCARVLFKHLHVELGLVNQPKYNAWLGQNHQALRWLPEFFAAFSSWDEPPAAATATPSPQPKPGTGNNTGSDNPSTSSTATTPTPTPTTKSSGTESLFNMDYLTPSQAHAFALFEAGHNIVVSGQAGTGKSYLLSKIRASAEAKRRKVLLTGSTGTSVQNINGHGTFNSVFGLGKGFDNLRPSGVEADSIMASSRRSQTRAGHMSLGEATELVVVVDEISMLDTKLLSLAATSAAKENIEIQWVLVGDPGQCTPPKGELFFKDFSLEYPGQAPEKYDSFLKTGDFKCVALKEVVRQAGDQAFLADLNALRVGRAPGPVVIERFKASMAGLPEDAIHTYFNNDSVMQHNREGTERLIAGGAASRTYRANVKLLQSGAAQWPKQFDPIEQEMVLAVGMPVMVRKNLKVDGTLVAANGSTGTILELRPSSVVLRLKNGKVIEIESQELDGPKDGQGRQLGKYVQLPLHPAFAVTGHKLQGLTLDEPLVVHPYQRVGGNRRPVSTPGWLYVVCSRVTRAEHLYFATEDPDSTNTFNWLLAGNRVDREALRWLESLG